MLILSRKAREPVYIVWEGKIIKISVNKINNLHQISLGIEAEGDVKIYRDYIVMQKDILGMSCTGQ